VIVDARRHLWDLGVRDQDWITDPPLGVLRRNFGMTDLEPLAEAAGVVRTVLVQTATVAEETPEFLAVAEESELVGAVVGWTDLTAPDVADTLAGLASGHGGRWLRGIRRQVQGEPDPEWLCREDVRRGLTAVGRAGLVHDPLTVPVQLPAALIRSLAAHDNVTCKVSGLVTEADWASWTVEDLRVAFEVVLDAFGPERLMFGSDWPVCLVAAEYADVVAAARELTGELSDAERAMVFTDTAVGVYGVTL
jgi:L-fuconolactonase